MTWLEIAEAAKELKARMAEATAESNQRRKEFFERSHRQAMAALGNPVDDEAED